MITLVILVIGIPFIFAIFMLQLEGRNLYFNLQKQLFSGHSSPDFYSKPPYHWQRHQVH